MAQVSRRIISKEVADRIFEVFIKCFIKIRNTEDANKLADDLFSPTEKVMLGKRLAIAFLLMKGYEYREIRDLIKVSTNTIAAISLSLNHGSGGYQNILNRISKEEGLENFFLNISEKLLSVPASSTKGSGLWRSLRADVQTAKKNKAKKSF